MLKSPEELPEGVDLAVFTLPAAGVRDAVAACVKRKVGSAMVFAAGFAEVGEQEMQDEIAKTAGIPIAYNPAADRRSWGHMRQFFKEVFAETK